MCACVLCSRSLNDKLNTENTLQKRDYNLDVVCMRDAKQSTFLAGCDHCLSFGNDNEVDDDNTSDFPIEEGTEVT